MQGVGRRQLLCAALGAAGAALVAGCRRISQPAPGCGSTARVTLYATPDFIPEYTVGPKLAAAFQAVDPEVTVIYPRGPGRIPSGQKWVIQSVQSGWQASNVQGAVVVPLAPALQSINFNPSVLLPGLVEQFSIQGAPYGLPSTFYPAGVVYNTHAFEQAGVAPPQPDWTIADLQNTCAALAHALGKGKLPGLVGVLPPAVGTSAYPGQGAILASSYTGWLQAGDATLWAGFAMGYGAQVLLDDGTIDLTGQEALLGLGTLVELARQYGAPNTALPVTASALRDLLRLKTVALEFVSRIDPFVASSGGSVRFARYPRLPVKSVVPAFSQGQTVGAAARLPSLTFPGDVLDAFVRFQTWTYGNDGQRIWMGADLPPVVADPAVQEAFWSHQMNVDVSPSDFVFMGSRQYDVYSPGVGQALAQAYHAPTVLADALRSAQGRVRAQALALRARNSEDLKVVWAGVGGGSGGATCP